MAGKLDRLARQAEQEPFFLAAALAEYARGEHLDEAGLARALGCTPEILNLLRLCRRPDREPGRFRHDVERIADRFGVQAGRLAEMVRRADALASMRQGATTGGRGTLIAARDRTGLAMASSLEAATLGRGEADSAGQENQDTRPDEGTER